MLGLYCARAKITKRQLQFPNMQKKTAAEAAVFFQKGIGAAAI
jgi:hypothetical protein